MSILNRILAGSGDGTFKKATFISVTGTEIKFAVEKEPTEYVLMWVPTSQINISTTVYYAFFCHTNLCDRLYRLYRSANSPNYSSQAVSNMTASYSGGVFTLTASSSSSGFNTSTSSTYVLYYR